ncbi:hypothetical protein A1Q2_05562 [Trichosporon asahii var. asahii CBS 8904]|uniref:Major facilitator superfamily (MFS) profile domain-containing protein n=1 Tax=Trichosporon asahii var. asahii (strain CBS 8904) TaxID=1220162 RepID=K1VH43_TRIAC|nr:hypothetical protein A1Q2_05562 [Trichosporon asahii var. asahii CBS 8904]
MSANQPAQADPPPGPGASGPTGTSGVAPLGLDTPTTTIDGYEVKPDSLPEGEGEKTIAWREEKLEKLEELEPTIPSSSDGKSDGKLDATGASHTGLSGHGGKSSDGDEKNPGHSGFVAFGKKMGELFGVFTPKGRPPGLKWRSASWFITAVVAVGVTMDVLAYAIIVPVLPYRLQALGHTGIAGKMTWLLFAYSAGIFICTFPVAFFFHRYPFRRGPLIVAVLVMEGSFVMFMLANPYWCMIVSRFLQGACSCVVWSVGLALICENIPEADMGKHLGMAVSGMSIGATIAPPIGGALYKHLGWHAPFIFCIIVCGVDLAARILVVERKDLPKWGVKLDAEGNVIDWGRGEETAETKTTFSGDTKVAHPPPSEPIGAEPHVKPTDPEDIDVIARGGALETAIAREHVEENAMLPEKPVELGPIQVLITLAKIPRGTVAFLLVFIFGFIIGAYDATLTLRVEQVWNKDSDFVGLIYLAAAAPAFFCGPISGYLADRIGPEVVLIPCLILVLPWMPLMILKTSLPGFMVFFAVLNCVATVLNVIASIEMAIASKYRPGISEIHEFAALNLAFAVSSAIGAIVGGQIYDAASNGWAIVCWICFAVFAVAAVPPFIWTGSRPFLYRMLRRPAPLHCFPPSERDAIAEKRRLKAMGKEPEADAVVVEEA